MNAWPWRQNTIRDRGKVRVPIGQDVKELIEAGHNRRDRETDVEQLVRLIHRILEAGCVQPQVIVKSC
jgi:hypothetical protein